MDQTSVSVDVNTPDVPSSNADETHICFGKNPQSIVTPVVLVVNVPLLTFPPVGIAAIASANVSHFPVGVTPLFIIAALIALIAAAILAVFSVNVALA